MKRPLDHLTEFDVHSMGSKWIVGEGLHLPSIFMFAVENDGRSNANVLKWTVQMDRSALSIDPMPDNGN